MVAIDRPVSPSSTLLWKLGQLLQSKAVRSEKRRKASNWLQEFVKFTLHIAGFACLTWAAFGWSMIAGRAVAGICFLLLAYQLTPDRKAEDGSAYRR